MATDRRNHRANGTSRGRKPGSGDSKPRVRRTKAQILAEKEGRDLAEAERIVKESKVFEKQARQDLINEKYENPELVGPPCTKKFDADSPPEMQTSLIKQVLRMAQQTNYLGDICKLVSAVCNFDTYNRSEDFEKLVDWMRSLDLLGGDYHFGEDADLTNEIALLNTAASTEVRRLKFIRAYDLQARADGIFKPIEVSILPYLELF